MPSLADAARHIVTCFSRPAAAVPPSEDVMFMNPRQLIDHFQRNQQSASSSGHVPLQPPICPPAQTQVPTAVPVPPQPPAQTQVPTAVPVIPISSEWERRPTPSQLDQAEEDYCSPAFSGQNRFTRRDPVQQDEAFRR
ncbi:MAG: hypothetical protein ACKPKO_22040, partial [Candidatus Fonsibacter sp.]